MTRRRRTILSMAITLATLTVPSPSVAETNSPNRLSGQQAFSACAGCHALGEDAARKIGPKLNGIVGATAASAANYAYSPSLTKSELRWTRENLFAWIVGSESMVPNSWMLYANVLEPEEIMALIDYLASTQR